MKQLSVLCLENPKLNGGSTTTIIEGKMTLVRVCEVTWTVGPFWVGTKF